MVRIADRYADWTFEREPSRIDATAPSSALRLARRWRRRAILTRRASLWAAPIGIPSLHWLVVWCLRTPIGAPLSSLGRPSSAISTAPVVGPSLGTSAAPSCRLDSSLIPFPSHSGMGSAWCLASHRLIALLILVLLVVSHRHSSDSLPSLGVSPRGQKLTLGLLWA